MVELMWIWRWHSAAVFFFFFSTCTPLLPAQNCVDFPLSDNNLEWGNENCVCCACVCVCVRTRLFSILLCHSFVQCAEPVSAFHCLFNGISLFFVQSLFFFWKRTEWRTSWMSCYHCVLILLQWRKEKVNELLLLCFWFCYTVEQFIVLLCMRRFLGVGGLFLPLLIRKFSNQNWSQWHN